MALADLDRLKANLLTSGLQNKDSALFQVINQLIAATKQLQNNTIVGISSITGNSNSPTLVGGTGITLDTSIPGQITINGSSGSDHVIVSDGNLPIPEPIDDGFGNFIYVAYTP